MTPALVSLHWGGREWGWRDNSIVGNESHDTRLRETCTVYLQCNRIKDTSPLKNNQAWTGLVISIQLSSLSQAIHKLVRQAWSKLVRQACILRILLVSSLHTTTPTVDQRLVHARFKLGPYIRPAWTSLFIFQRVWTNIITLCTGLSGGSTVKQTHLPSITIFSGSLYYRLQYYHITHKPTDTLKLSSDDGRILSQWVHLFNTLHQFIVEPLRDVPALNLQSERQGRNERWWRN